MDRIGDYEQKERRCKTRIIKDFLWLGALELTFSDSEIETFFILVLSLNVARNAL